MPDIMFRFFRNRRRARIRNQPFPETWLGWIQQNVPIYEQMPEADKRELRGHVQVFLAEKRFEGCGGLEITDEIRVTIAAQACVLLVRRPMDYFPKLRSILVYPAAFTASATSVVDGNIVAEGPLHRLGESWTTGSVVLSWNAVERGASHLHDGQNVVFHEFAHQLDQEDGAGDGAPLLGKRGDFTLTERRSLYVSWARVMQDAFDQLQFRVRHGKKTLLDDYGATNPAEFFAVATETFFEKPRLLKKRHPELYDELSRYYHQDPAAWRKDSEKA